MKTQIIASWKLVSSNNRDMYIVTTVDGETVWVPKNQFDTNAEIITFTPRKAGEKYVNSKGEEGTLKSDRNDYVGAGKQIVKKFNSVELLDHVVSKGIVPTFALN